MSRVTSIAMASARRSVLLVALLAVATWRALGYDMHEHPPLPDGDWGPEIKPCPNMCHCYAMDPHSNPAYRGCKVVVRCGGRQTWPRPREYPDAMDCVNVVSPFLKHLSSVSFNNHLQTLPRNLRKLDLHGCGLREYHMGNALGHLRDLRVLNLEFNRFWHLPADAFYNLRRLKVLKLTGNRHKDSEEEEHIKLGGHANELEFLEPTQFKDLYNLRVLYLAHNMLKELPKGVFASLKKLKVLKIYDNPFSPPLTKDHPEIAQLTELVQLDIEKDSGESHTDAHLDELIESETLLYDELDGREYEL